MRRVHRPTLPLRVQKYLDGRKQATAGVISIETAWKSARQTKTMALVVQTLQAMMGKRERCMYCVDSHGGDIEHFWPKSSYPAKAFEWQNLLLCCTECGRLKGMQFPLSEGQPMLVDPSIEDPWEYLDFDPDTGNLTARYDAATAAPMYKGEQTVQVLHLDRRESMAEGYRRTYRRLAACISQALAADPIDPQKLVEDLLQTDENGLLGWCFGPIGEKFKPFEELRRKAPNVWAVCVTAVQS